MANEIIKGMGFHHIALKCKDIEKSLQMYKALGMTEVARWGEGERLIVMLDVGDGGRIELFANGSDEYSVMGKWQHFAMKVDDVEQAYAVALAAGFTSKIAPKVVPLDSKPEKMSIQIAFVLGNDGEEVEFFKEV
jgi:catechol 2,3-dioxygenase-like lactoylglutathione lyase family enzyme